MDVIGYLVTLANLQNLSRVGTPLVDSSLHIGTLYDLTKELVSIPDFTLEGYKENGFQKHGNLGVYASKNLREFIYNGVGSPSSEGVIIKLHYGDSKTERGNFDSISYLIYGDEIKVDVKEVNGHHKEITTREIINDHRNKRSLLDKLIS